jgi:hypothetical protein
MDDAFTLRLHTELDGAAPALQAEVAEIARAVLELPPKRGRALARILAEVLRPFVDGNTPDAAWTARYSKLPKADQAVVDRFVMQLYNLVFDALVDAVPAERRQAFEKLRIR